MKNILREQILHEVNTGMILTRTFLKRMKRFNHWMPGVKGAVFTKRIVTFNMTFAPLGGRKGGRPLGIIWHEETCGRNDEDITNTCVKFVKDFKRDCHIITWWADNCSAQNKNRTPFSTLCQLVNDPSTSCDMITIKYFEPGHTFMAADSFHKRVEDEMKKMKQVLDFEGIAAQGIALEMSDNYFYEYRSKVCKGKDTNYPYLDHIVVVQFRRGSNDI